MAWLGTWAKRREITISNTNIDGDLTHFPIPIFINSTSGTGNTDITDIFTEVGANSQKIAVTKSDGTTQIYVEIEKWDNGGSTANLWASKSDLTVSSSASTTLYIYYDNAQSDNTTFVGLLGSRTEVYDSNYVGVWHLAGATAATELDSTSNNNDLGNNSTSTGVTSVSGAIDGAKDFEETNTEYLNISNASQTGLGLTTDFSFEAIINAETLGSNQTILVKENPGTSEWGYIFRILSGKLNVLFRSGAPSTTQRSATNALSTSTTYSVAGTADISVPSINLYVDGVLVAMDAISGTNTTLNNNAAEFAIGFQPVATLYDGIIDETRVSKIVRPAEWIKANHQSSVDNIMSFGSTENFAGTTFIPKVIFF